MNKTRNVAVVAAHPDDEVLGCGGTMAKHAAAGDQVHVLILAEGATSRDVVRLGNVRAGEVSALRQAAERAAETLSVTSLSFADFPDNRMDSCDLLDVVKVVEAFFSEHAPEVVYTHHGGDMNVDHVLTQRSVATALRPVPGATFVRLLHFEVASSTEWGGTATANRFGPQWFEDIHRFLDLKLKALSAYESELRAFPHPRSIDGVKAQAQLQGACAGVPAAEAFMLGWQVQRDQN